MTTTAQPASRFGTPRAAGGFVPALEGMRGIAALGIVVTHVAFQTATTSPEWFGRILGRLDLAVALFFALSGFLLWRPHAAAARGLGAPRSVWRYWLSRATRILPAYWLCVTLVLLLLPGATGASTTTWLANLALVQVFVPLTLAEGLTQMWSLSVEVAFYVLLPFVAIALSGLRGRLARARVPLLLTVSAASLGWAFVPIAAPEHISHTNWLPAYIPWFAVGMVLAELVVSAPAFVHRLGAHRVAMGVLAAVAFGLACTPLAGPAGLAPAAPWQFAIKIALGAITSFALLAPLVLGEGRHRLLTSPAGLAIGRWSYGIFVWHLAVLASVFPLFQTPAFGGNFVFVLVVTLAGSIVVASASYALVEEPSRRAVDRLLNRRSVNRSTTARESGSVATPSATTDTTKGS
ncbi:acyltransferase family protein [Rhodococcus rhodnii]|uniref:Acyltransferase n=1 Tax=Rhodococcus rhodnii LMG 5362 TaxID=1273125 RepID=R7WM30_9NOCA|nr:acyltransferase [Rhodococcus rhodnii]EOM76348.1 acyltransferase [Rhodococcus rhodnii LMG 5362]